MSKKSKTEPETKAADLETMPPEVEPEGHVSAENWPSVVISETPPDPWEFEGADLSSEHVYYRAGGASAAAAAANRSRIHKQGWRPLPRHLDVQQAGMPHMGDDSEIWYCPRKLKEEADARRRNRDVAAYQRVQKGLSPQSQGLWMDGTAIPHKRCQSLRLPANLQPSFRGPKDAVAHLAKLQDLKRQIKALEASNG